MASEAIHRLESQVGGQVNMLLSCISIKVANLSSGVLGEASGNTIWIDDDAAGHGWFVDPTPSDDMEFADLLAPHVLAARKGSSAANRVDLLTTVMHEMGHILGYDHSDSLDLMAPLLAPRVRMPLAGQSPLSLAGKGS